ncbi:nuclear transport factor 2 family protein [Chloroflexota bacterium]
MSPAKMARIESCTRTVIDLLTAYNQHDIPSLLTFLSPDCILETASPAPDGTTLKGSNAISSHLQDLFAQNPDLKLEIENIFGQAFHVVIRWQQVGGEAPLRGVDIFKFRGEQLSEWLRYVKR